MRSVGVLEARTHFSALLDAVERGERVIITRKGRPIADLGPPQAGGMAEDAAERVDALRRRVAHASDTSAFDLEAEIAEMRGRD